MIAVVSYARVSSREQEREGYSIPAQRRLLGEYAKNRQNPYSALQCGPLLVDGGRVVRGLDASRSARRTFAAVAGDRVALGFCSETSLAGACHA